MCVRHTNMRVWHTEMRATDICVRQKFFASETRILGSVCWARISVSGTHVCEFWPQICVPDTHFCRRHHHVCLKHKCVYLAQRCVSDTQIRMPDIRICVSDTQMCARRTCESDAQAQSQEVAGVWRRQPTPLDAPMVQQMLFRFQNGVGKTQVWLFSYTA